MRWVSTYPTISVKVTKHKTNRKHNGLTTSVPTAELLLLNLTWYQIREKEIKQSSGEAMMLLLSLEKRPRLSSVTRVTPSHGMPQSPAVILMVSGVV